MSSINSQKNIRQHVHKMHGFTLLEALLGFLILSIGMLGIASLQAVSLKAGKTSVYGSIAMMKAEELIESMRANPGNAAFPNTLGNYVGAGAAIGCTASACPPMSLASDEKFLWAQSLTAALPGTVTSTVTVAPLVAPSRVAVVNVVISWTERSKTAAAPVTKSLNVSSSICVTTPC